SLRDRAERLGCRSCLRLRCRGERTPRRASLAGIDPWQVLPLIGQDLLDSVDRERVIELFRVMLPYYLHQRARDWRFLGQQRRVCAMLDGRVGTVLDIGCGPGLMTKALVERGWDVWGLDVLESAVRWARAEAEQAPWADRAHYVVGDANALPFSPAT